MRVEDTVPSPLAQNRDRFRLSFTICRRQGATIITSEYEQVHYWWDPMFRLGFCFERLAWLRSRYTRPTLVYISTSDGTAIEPRIPWRAMSKSDVEGGVCEKVALTLTARPRRLSTRKGTVESYLCLISEEDAPRHSHTWLYAMRRTRQICCKMGTDRHRDTQRHEKREDMRLMFMSIKPSSLHWGIDWDITRGARLRKRRRKTER